MAVPLLVVLMAGYMVIGLVARDYNWRTRAMVVGLAFVAPSWFYFFF